MGGLFQFGLAGLGISIVSIIRKESFLHMDYIVKIDINLSVECIMLCSGFCI